MRPDGEVIAVATVDPSRPGPLHHEVSVSSTVWHPRVDSWTRFELDHNVQR
jgi:hypothetical protein